MKNLLSKDHCLYKIHALLMESSAPPSSIEIPHFIDYSPIFTRKSFPLPSRTFQKSQSLCKGNSSQIRQIHVKSKILKFLKYSPFDSLIENRKFQNLQLHSSSGSDFMAILRSFATEFADKM